MKRLSLSSQVLLGLALGVVAGIFFGEPAAKDRTPAAGGIGLGERTLDSSLEGRGRQVYVNDVGAISDGSDA